MIGVSDVFFGVLSVFIIKFMDPNAVAISVISRNKTVFERLAEM